MKLVRQPKDSTLCGQACVATLAGITLGKSIMFFGHKGRTRYKAVIQALHQLGVDSGPGWKKGFPKCKTAVMLYRLDGEWTGSHWVVWHKKKYYDPAAGVFRKEPKWLKDSRVTSHLEVRCDTE